MLYEVITGPPACTRRHAAHPSGSIAPKPKQPPPRAAGMKAKDPWYEKWR